MSLRSERPLIHVRGGRVWDESPEITELKCRGSFLRRTNGFSSKRWVEVVRETLG